MRATVLAAIVGLIFVAPSTAPAQESYRDCPACPEMVRIPAGSFLMGTAGKTDPLSPPEGPQHRVTISYTFSLGKYEVTRAEFEAFVRATGYSAAGNWRDKLCCDERTDREPVVGVSWTDGKAYVAWLSQVTGKKYRLPSEAEWEYAARAGTATARYWGESHSCEYANVYGNIDGCRDDYQRTAPVGSFRPNSFGLYDMLGNAWEWLEDCWNENYAGAPSDGSAWQEGDCSFRVMRGGSWAENARVARAAHRWRHETENRGDARGFRVARND